MDHWTNHRGRIYSKSRTDRNKEVLVGEFWDEERAELAAAAPDMAKALAEIFEKARSLEEAQAIAKKAYLKAKGII